MEKKLALLVCNKSYFTHKLISLLLQISNTNWRSIKTRHNKILLLNSFFKKRLSASNILNQIKANSSNNILPQILIWITVRVELDSEYSIKMKNNSIFNLNRTM